MKQYHFYFDNESSFEKELNEFKEKIGRKKAVFQIFSEVLYSDAVAAARAVIEKVFPEYPYVGASTGGIIINCQCGKAYQWRLWCLTIRLRTLRCVSLICRRCLPMK